MFVLLHMPVDAQTCLDSADNRGHKEPETDIIPGISDVAGCPHTKAATVKKTF